MSIGKAEKTYKTFHLKNPNKITKLKTKIPRLLYPVGIGVQISYRSNKWRNDNKFVDYIHFWENETIVCVPEYLLSVDTYKFPFCKYSNPIDVGEKRNEVVFLGYPIDIHVSRDNRSNIKIRKDFVINDQFANDDIFYSEKIIGSSKYNFNPCPNESREYVACSPNGKIVYIICDDTKEVFAFINKKLKITNHGIEG
jgi:hypothetical protein